MSVHADTEADADTLESHVEALLETVTAGHAVTIDDLEIEHQAEGYRFAIDALERTGLTEAECRRTLEQYPEYVTNYRYWEDVGGEGMARRAFLRWCERAPVAGADASAVEHEHGHGHDHGSDLEHEHEHNHEHKRNQTETHPVSDRYEALADGIHREWGQVLITTHLADPATGERRYELRHVDEAAVPEADLEKHTDPRDARELVTYDGRERYRPLKTAPTLVGGWYFPDLTGTELVRTVDFIYPATVANWHREQVGELDVDHWIDTAERQTGIYDVIDELPRTAVDWMAEACCDDSQCLRRREWQYDEEHELDADGGDGVFPCREPCSLVVAAARKWTVLESEEPKRWELELTTSEKNQLAEIIDAVADGRIDAIREADVYDGGNRYRARYLRAKLFDDEGGIPAREVEHGHAVDGDEHDR